MAGQGIKARNLTLRAHFGADRHPTLSLPTLWFGLYRGNPAAGGVEPNGTGAYTRVSKPNDATLWGTIAAGDVFVTNQGSAGAIEWPSTTGVYSFTEPLTWVGVHDLSSGGVLWYWQELQTPIAVTQAGDIPRLPIGALDLHQPE